MRSGIGVAGGRGSRPAFAWVAIAAAAMTCACGAAGGTGEADAVVDDADARGEDGVGLGDTQADAPGDVEVPTGYDEHTRQRLPTRDEFFAWAGPDRAPAQVKFVIRGSESPDWTLHLMQSGFYAMHDEWSWYRLLNGVPIPGYEFAPVPGLAFSSIAEVVAWAKATGEAALPLDLTFVGKRLYSPRFYEHAWSLDRFFAVGSVLHYDPDPRRPRPDELWLYEPEHGDPPDADVIRGVIDRLEPALPPEAAGRLAYLPRSLAQREFAKRLQADGDPLGRRVVFYEDIVIPGEAVPYNPGIAAGTVRIVRAGQSPMGLVQPTDVVVLEEIPDDIPPVAAIVSAVPQTPLAHVALLAKARGTPNVHVGNASKDPQIETWGYYRKPVVIEVTGAGYRMREMTMEQWTAWLSMTKVPTVAIPQVDLAAAPETLDPTVVPFAQMPGLVPLVGGKSAGFVALSGWPGIDLPDSPLAITIKGYADFLEQSGLRGHLTLLLSHADFQNDPRVRLLVLEGREAFEAAMGAIEPQFVAAFEAKYPGSHILRWTYARGGVMRMVRDSPLHEGYLDRVTAALRQRFAALAPAQGLRFRSSSTAEDIEGFNGAGLYASYTGYLHPEAVSDSKKDKTVEAAIRKVWASYWLFGAFEERRAAGISHLSGNMGMVVHPVHDDDLEAANGVATLELVRRPEGVEATLVANTQKGALSVTNPGGTGALPEVDEVRQGPGGEPEVRRVRDSTEAPGERLVSDAELLWMHDVLGRMASAWLDLRNAGYAAQQHGRVITLDVEFRRMSEGWPALASGHVNPSRLVLRQVRTLESPSRVGATVSGMPVPRDLLPRTVRVHTRTCTFGAETVDVTEALTDPTRPWPFDHGVVPFDSYAKVHALGAWLMHDQAAFGHPGMQETGAWALDLRPNDPAKARFTRITVEATGAWVIDAATGSSSGAGAKCAITPIFRS
ncbi:MAG: hypothetical protein FJ087_21235, partial [Deltaproteobacteria bacterium]|nr:hypothetical protein [Deltaproteobacteria bacterium]